MRQIIKEAYLNEQIKRLNAKKGLDNPAYNTPGAYQLDMAYGGYKLVQVMNAGGGIKEVSTGGYGTKRDLYNQMNTLLNF